MKVGSLAISSIAFLPIYAVELEVGVATRAAEQHHSLS